MLHIAMGVLHIAMGVLHITMGVLHVTMGVLHITMGVLCITKGHKTKEEKKSRLIVTLIKRFDQKNKQTYLFGRSLHCMFILS